MSDTLLVTRPRHDGTTIYLYYWASLVIREAIKKNCRVIDLDGPKAVKMEFTGRMQKVKPDLIFLNGHGSPTSIAGHNNEILLNANDNEEILSGTNVYALSCSSAEKLGRSSIKKGAKSYIGYIEDFIFLHEKDKISKPLGDKTAGLFLGPSNLVPIALVKGNTPKEAFDRSQKEFNRNLRKLMTSESPQQDNSSIPWLYWDMTHQICLEGRGG